MIISLEIPLEKLFIWQLSEHKQQHALPKIALTTGV